MPPPLLLDLSRYDLNATQLDRQQIYERLPQRYEFEQLDAIVAMDLDGGCAVARRDIRADEWWVRGHIPGRPIFPGVLMLESAAQVAAVLSTQITNSNVFVAFGGVDSCKFRDSIVPPARMFLLAKQVDCRRRRFIVDCQGVVDDRMIFEARITGLSME